MGDTMPHPHPQLPVHPLTGVTAIGMTRRGPIWPVIGAAETVEESPPSDDKSKADADPQGFPAKTPVAEMTPEQQVAYWRDKARKHEERSKSQGDYEALKQKAQEFDKLTEAQKTELEKAQGEAEKYRTEAQNLQSQVLRRDVAAAKGLPGNMAARLVGDTKDELEADADALLELIKPGPQPDPDQGTRGKGQTKPTVASGRDLYAQRHKPKHTT